MLSKGAKQIKLSLGIPPTDYDENDAEPDVSCIDFLSPKGEEFISNLEENNADEAKEHRKDILCEFYSHCEALDIDTAEIEEWPRLNEIGDEDRLFIEAMNDYSKWGVSQDTKNPMSAYAMGKMFAAFLHSYECQPNSQNIFQRKCKSVLTDNPDKAQGLIGIRAIANGD